MKECIEREAVVSELNRIEKFYQNTYVSNVRAEMASYCCQVIKHIPTADVLEVVRCPECVHHVDCGYHFCNKWCANCPDDSDFFCAYGERDGGADDGRT